MSSCRSWPRSAVSFSLAAALLVSPSSGFAAPSPAADPTAVDPPTPEPASDEPAPEPALPVSEPEAPLPEPAPPVSEPEAALPEPAPIADTEADIDDDDDGDLDDDEDAAFEDDYDLLRDSPEGRSARRWLSAGIAATITGTVLVGGAVAYGVADPCSPAAGNNCFTDARDRGAVSMGVPGGVLLLGGAAMIVVGVLQRRRLQHSVAVLPTGTGVLLVGRF